MKARGRGARGGGEESGRSRAIAIAIAALLAGVVTAVILISGGGGYKVTAQFEAASKLVPGNQVVIGAQPMGSVEEVRLGPDGQANVTLSIDDEYAPLRRGTTATVRWASLSSVANRQVELTFPPDGQGEEIPDGGVLTQTETIADVEVDQFFNMLDERTIKDFKRVVKGFARAYEGVAPQANRGYKYLNPLLYNSRRVFAELNSDQAALDRLLVDGSRFAGALAERSDDLSQLVHNLNLMMNAIGDRKLRLARAISLLPPFLRNANTTFVNLRAALDDLQPFAAAARPAAKELLPFLIELRATARNAVPTVRDLSAIIRAPGKANDLVELQLAQPPLRDAAIGSGFPECGPGPEDPDDLEVAADDDYTQGSFGEAICSLSNGHPNLTAFRAYIPDVVGWFDGFGHSGYVDAVGGLARVGTTVNTFSPSSTLLPNLADPDTPAEQLAALTTGYTRRCPGSSERPLGAGPQRSVPFTDRGHLTDGVPADCDPTQVQPGP
jgi:phospholipid/cholesterol/gamma-HCH transport system substrate-binding protein